MVKLLILLWLPALAGSVQSAEQRIAERLKALHQEAAQLASRETTILTDLRKLEIEREIKATELAAVEQDLQQTQAQLTDAIARAAALRERADTQRPDIDARLTRLYKMGRAGYWRLLLDVDDLRAMGRTYRTAAALTRLDGERIRQYQQTLADLTKERARLEERAKAIALLQEQAAVARAAVEKAVASRTALLASVEARRDLALQLANELEEAQQRLQASVTPGATRVAVLPLKPFRGDVPWPAEGFVLSRFGRQPGPGGMSVTKNGIEISLAEGRAVNAVHEGVVSFAGPFTGYGQLVIVDHGDNAHSLYGHLGQLAVNKGDRVTPQTRLGTSGRNPGGNPALYFELRVDGKAVDPLQWLRK
jgi:murein hydrolase activator